MVKLTPETGSQPGFKMAIPVDDSSQDFEGVKVAVMRLWKFVASFPVKPVHALLQWDGKGGSPFGGAS